MKRDKVDIIARILEVSKKGCTKTKILSGAKLTSNQLKDYLPFMVSTGLLGKQKVKGKTFFVSTVRGERFVGFYKELHGLLEPRSFSEYLPVNQTLVNIK
jgi:predicted transcriptional regulator